MNKEQQLLLPMARDLLKDICKSCKEELITKKDGDEFYFPHSIALYIYEVEESLIKVENHTNGIKYIYSNYKRSDREKPEHIDNEGIEAKIKIEVFLEAYRYVKGFGDIWMDFRLAFFSKKGNPAIIKSGIDKFTSPETFDTFKDLYNFTKI
jgi:hypothetical protein